MMADGGTAICLRAARAADAAAIARLIVMAGGGVYEFLLDGLFGTADAGELLVPGIIAGFGPFSHRQCTVAACDDEVIGIAHAYPAAWMGSGDQGILPPERRMHLAAFEKTQDSGSYFFSALAVLPPWRGRGIASRLVAHTESRAMAEGFDRMTLHVWADNTLARRLYERLGFETAAVAAIPPHPRLPHEGGSLLMRKRLQAAGTSAR